MTEIEHELQDWISKCELLDITVKSLIAQCKNRTDRFEKLAEMLSAHHDDVCIAWGQIEDESEGTVEN